MSYSKTLCTYVTHRFFLIPAIALQNVTDESYLACIKSEKYVVWVTLRSHGSIRQGEAELRTLQYEAGCRQATYIETHFSD